MRFGDEEACDSARYVSDTLEELLKFISKAACPNVLVFFHFHQVSIVKDIACVVVNDGTNEVDGGVRGWGGGLQEDAFCCKSIPTVKSCLMLAKQRCGHEFIGNDAINNQVCRQCIASFDCV